jgi:hypothetical protein
MASRPSYAESPLELDSRQLARATTLLSALTSPPPDFAAATQDQQAFVFSPARAVEFAGDFVGGKSTALAQRAVMLASVYGAGEHSMRVIAASIRGRGKLESILFDEVRRLTAQCEQEGASAPSLGLPRVQTVSSLIATLLRSIQGPQARLIDESQHTGACHQMSTGTDRSSGKHRRAARSVVHTSELDRLISQAFNQCTTTSAKFRDHLREIALLSLSSAALTQDEPEVQEAIARWAPISELDAIYTEQVERDWTGAGLWPIAGVRCVDEHGLRYAVNTPQGNMAASGYIERWNVHVVLAARNKLRDEKVSRGERSPTFSRFGWAKARIARASTGSRVLVVSKVSELVNLDAQLRSLKGHEQSGLPDFLWVPPGEHRLKRIGRALYEFATFVLSEGIDLQDLCHSHVHASDRTRVALANAAALFYQEFRLVQEHRNAFTVDECIARMSDPAQWLYRLPLSAAMTFQHVVVDDVDELSPSFSRLVVAIQERLFDLSAEFVHSTVQCTSTAPLRHGVSQTGWTGFAALFEGGATVASSDSIDSRTVGLIRRMARASMAAAPHTDLPALDSGKLKPDLAERRLAIVRQFTDDDVVATIERLQSGTGSTLSILVITADSIDASLTRLSVRLSSLGRQGVDVCDIHDCAGADADVVILVGDTKYPLSNAIRNETLRFAHPGLADPAPYDARKKQEAALRVYRALMRARQACVWFCTPFSGGTNSNYDGQRALAWHTDPMGAYVHLRFVSRSDEIKAAQEHEAVDTVDAVDA